MVIFHSYVSLPEGTDPKVHLHLEFPTDDRKKSPVVLQGTTTVRLAS
jgi:hypothetical protein